ncbi:NAD(P)-binding protein [Pholiota conissans]|uniref:NAD(P)-binding protein n=1 Tax=Pholiota conissans TaxID=109636 RepID=A0A9P6CTM9_9AGAR|nr:NAD(P)-binding protein [Pholiota conissans]
MAGELVVITGVSGNVGFRVLFQALAHGYKARALVRKQSQIEHIKSIPSIEKYADNLEFALVPDFTAPGAFDTHVADATFVVHVAAPLYSTTDVPIDVAEFASTTRNMTKNILEAASKTPTVKRVVITASISALFTGEAMQKDSDVVYSWKSPICKDFITPMPEKAAGPIAYVISKVLAALDVDQYVAEKKPHYSVASIFIGTVIGPNDLFKTATELLKSSNVLAVAPLLGMSFPPIQSVYIHLDDAAMSHIRALTIDLAPGTTRNIVSAYNTVANPDSVRWNDSIDIAKKEFPAALESGVFPLGGAVSTLKALVDSAEDERVLGMKFKPLEVATREVISQYVELVAKA